MARFDASSAECLVFTYKEGLLSAVAHNLKLRVTAFTLEVDDSSQAVRARFDPTSIRVVNAMKDGKEDPGALSDGDRQKIEANMRERVIQTGRFPEIRFESTAVTPEGGGFQVRGLLTLHGVQKEIAFPVRRASSGPDAGRYVAEVNLNQPEFGITPFSAMMGTLKVRPDVTVRMVAALPP